MDSEEPVNESSQCSKEDFSSTDVDKEVDQCEKGIDQLELTDIEAIEQDKAIDCPLQDSEVKELLNINDETTGDHEVDDSDVGSVSSGASQDVPIEREEGDGQESDKKDKKLDRDEDKRDPQYIPKKGNFYEHDDRTSEGEEPSNGKKHLTPKAFESKERWGHDLYDDNSQSPKTKEELIEQYGYDIRLEEGPPKARRRRRYGRGPNKYTRRWEEEEAYAKGRVSWRGRGRGRSSRINVEDFPPLPEKEALVKAATDEKNPENKQDSVKKEPIKTLDNKVEKKDTLSVTQSARKVKIDETSIHSANVPRGRGSTRGRGRVSQPFKSGCFQRQSSTAEEDIATLSKHFTEAVINVDNKSIPSKRASSVPPTSSNELNGTKHQQSSEDTVVDKSGVESKSKRYSMQRQRSLPQANTNGVGIVQQASQPPPPPPQHFIQPDQQQYFHQVGLDATPGAPTNQYANQAPANFRPEVTPMVAFVSPAAHQFHQPLPTYLPPTFLTPPPLATPPRGPEVYQGPTGITYYNTQSQEGGSVRTEGLRCALARLRNRTPNNNNQNPKQNEGTLGDDIIASASTALRRLHFRGASRKGKLPSSIGSSQNTSTDSANTVITMVTVDTEDGLPPTPSATALLDDLVAVEEPEEQLETRQIPRVPAKRLKLLSKRYAKTNFDDEVRHGRGSSGFAAEQMTIDSEYGSVDPPSSPPLPDSPTSRSKQELVSVAERKPRKSVSLPQESKTSIVVQQASVQATSPEVEYSLEQRRVENMRLLEVATTLTPDQLREFEMKYGSPHHSRSQSVKPRSRPNSLTLPPARTRVASMPNTGAEEHYYRLRHFSITGKGVINRGDYLKSKLEKSQGSVSSNSASTDQLGPPSRQSSCVSCPGSHGYSYRVIMLGASAVGKTSLISQFMTSEYLAPYDTSIDDDFAEKSVSVLLDGEESELVFIDHPSSQLTPDSWMESSASAYCVVYSASDGVSFKVANECLAALWASDITRNKAVILVSNKSDLVRSKVISTQEGKDTARRYDSKFIETSVGLNHRVDELLVGVLTQIRLKDAERKKPQEEHKTGLFPKSRGKGTSASLKVKGLLSKVWARDSKSKSCENLHVL